MNIKTIFFIITIFLIAFLYKKYQIKPVKDPQLIVVGTSADYPPYEYVDTKTSEIVGFDIDVMKSVAERLNKKIIIQNMSFTSLVFALLAEEIDLIAAGMSPTPRRSKFVLFTDKYLDGDYFVVVSKKDIFIPKSLEDLKGKQVVVNTGYTAEAFMAKQEGVHLIRLKDVSLGLVSIQTGSADAFVCAQSVLKTILQKKNNSDQFALLPLHGTGDDCAFAVKKENTQLADQVNNVLEIMHQDGTLEQLKNKWNV